MASYRFRFVSPPPDDVICPLCLDIVEEPYQFTCCGQHICKKCGDKLKQQATTPHCPMCRHDEYMMSPDKYFERNILNKLLIWCTEGCGQEVELGQLKNHLPQCPCIKENCPYGCGQQYQRQYIEEHKEKCSKRPFICDYCKYQSTYEVIVNEHYPVCDKYPIICPNECSGDEIERGVLQDHLDKCPFQVVECEFSHVGCLERVRRCDLAQHLCDNGVHHSALSSKMIYESLQKKMEEKDGQLQEKETQLAKKDNELRLTVQQKDKQLQEKDKQLQEKDKQLQEKDKQLQEKDRQLQEKDRQLKEKETQLAKKDNELRLTVQQKDKQIQDKDRQLQEKDRLMFEVQGLIGENKTLLGTIYDKICKSTVLSVTMTEFMHKKDNKVRWYSPPYFTHLFGYKMCFEVDFCHNKTLLRIDSYIMRGRYDDHLQWPFKGKVIIQLLNQCGDHHHYDYVFDYKDRDDKGGRVTSGERGKWHETQSECLPLLQLGYSASTDSQYLKDDCLKFKVINENI